jgi:hypothetical protein
MIHQICLRRNAKKTASAVLRTHRLEQSLLFYLLIKQRNIEYMNTYVLHLTLAANQKLLTLGGTANKSRLRCYHRPSTNSVKE